jgi:hypothetical protein
MTRSTDNAIPQSEGIAIMHLINDSCHISDRNSCTSDTSHRTSPVPCKSHIWA